MKIVVAGLKFEVQDAEDAAMLEEMAEELTEADFEEIARSWDIDDLDTNPEAEERVGRLITLPYLDLAAGGLGQNG